MKKCATGENVRACGGTPRSARKQASRAKQAQRAQTGVARKTDAAHKAGRCAQNWALRTKQTLRAKRRINQAQNKSGKGAAAVETRLESQLKKGVLEMLVLRLLCRAPGHGYALMERMNETSGGMFQLKEGTLYPILYRLEDEGLIESSWQAGPGRGAPKKVYTVTDAGRRAQRDQSALWRRFCACVAQFDEDGEGEA